MINALVSDLSKKGYWPAVAMESFMEKKYSRATEICQSRLLDHPENLSGRVILGMALYHSGQYDSAREQFHKILQIDPAHLVALKYLGDLNFREGEEDAAFAHYDRILRIAPFIGGISSSLDRKPGEATRVLTLRRKEEDYKSDEKELKGIPFKTETLGDLLVAQGHPRLAVEIFGELVQNGTNPRLQEKLSKTIDLIKNKDRRNV